MNLLSDRIKHAIKESLPEEGQAGLVRDSGASKSVVNQWLDGKIKSMRLDYALKIEENLGYNHIWLVLGIGEIKTPKLEAELLGYFRRISDEIKPITVRTVKSHVDVSQQPAKQEPILGALAPNKKSLKQMS